MKTQNQSNINFLKPYLNFEHYLMKLNRKHFIVKAQVK